MAIIDDAIVGVNHIARRLRQRREEDDTSTAAVILDAALDMRRPLGYAVVILVAAVVPIYFVAAVCRFYPWYAGAPFGESSASRVRP